MADKDDDELDEDGLPSVTVLPRQPASVLSGKGPSPKPPSPFITVDPRGVQRFAGYVIPHTANRIQVLDLKGQKHVRKLADLQNGDTPVLNNAGLPVFIEGSTGRPPKLGLGGAALSALPPASPLIGDLLRLKEAHLRSDPIIQVAEATPESSDVLNQVLLAIAEEAASLRFERMESERQGGDTSQHSVRRVAALKAIGDTWIKRKEQINSRMIDMDSPTFQVLFQFITETFVRALQASNVRQEMVDTVVAQFVKMLDDTWKNEAKSRMKE